MYHYHNSFPNMSQPSTPVEYKPCKTKTDSMNTPFFLNKSLCEYVCVSGKIKKDSKVCQFLLDTIFSLVSWFFSLPLLLSPLLQHIQTINKACVYVCVSAGSVDNPPELQLICIVERCEADSPYRRY